MLKIRLQRVGKKADFSFRMVLTDSRNATKSGRFLEVLGTYHPKLKTFAAKADRIKHWLSKGVQLTPTLHNLLITHKVIEGKKINVLPKKTPPPVVPVEVAPEAPKAEVEKVVAEDREEAPPAEAPAEEVATEEKPAEQAAA